MGTSSADRDTGITLSVDEHDVVRLAWAPGLQIDADLADRAMRAVDELNGDRPRALYVDMTGTALLTRDGRRRFAEECSACCIALVGKSAVDRVLANFSLMVSAPPVPTRFFTAESEALDWLRDGRAHD